MKRPPLFTKEAIEKATEKVRLKGSEAIQNFLMQEEPALLSFVKDIMRGSIQRLYGDKKPQNKIEATQRERLAGEIHFAAAKTLMVIRECYRDLSENLLAAQFALPAKQPPDSQCSGKS